MDWGGIASYIF